MTEQAIKGKEGSPFIIPPKSKGKRQKLKKQKLLVGKYPPVCWRKRQSATQDQENLKNKRNKGHREKTAYGVMLKAN